jgi:hypothetical protein
MSQNNIATLPNIEKFFQRVHTAERTNQKEIRVTIVEARDLMNDLALLTSSLGKTITDIHAKLDKLTAENKSISVSMDGGTF